MSIEEKNSPNGSSKNKTIPQTVHQGINNFCKPSVASIENMSECLKMFKFIIAQSSNIRRCEHIYHWKYGSNYLKYVFILFQKTTCTCRKSDTLLLDIRWHHRRIFDTLLLDIRWHHHWYVNETKQEYSLSQAKFVIILTNKWLKNEWLSLDLSLYMSMLFGIVNGKTTWSNFKEK